MTKLGDVATSPMRSPMRSPDGRSQSPDGRSQSPDGGRETATRPLALEHSLFAKLHPRTADALTTAPSDSVSPRLTSLRPPHLWPHHAAAAGVGAGGDGGDGGGRGGGRAVGAHHGASPPLPLPSGASRLISRNLASERESLASPPRSHHGSVSSGASGGTDGWAEGWAESGACSSILAEAYEEIASNQASSQASSQASGRSAQPRRAHHGAHHQGAPPHARARRRGDSGPKRAAASPSDARLGASKTTSGLTVGQPPSPWVADPLRRRQRGLDDARAK
jgi:hypothetical protein